jgi:uncharacterized protein YjiS (DUF1127 family)
MTDIAMHALNRGWNLGKISSFRDTVTARYRCWRTYRAVKAELRQYEPEHLADFGVAEADIDIIAREAARL